MGSPIYIAWSEEHSLRMTFKAQRRRRSQLWEEQRTGCSRQREQHVQRLQMRQILASSRHRKAVSVPGTQWSKDGTEGKDVREGSGATSHMAL